MATYNQFLTETISGNIQRNHIQELVNYLRSGYLSDQKELAVILETLRKVKGGYWGYPISSNIILMKVSEKGKRFLKNREGIIFSPKVDFTDKTTSNVGYGHQILPSDNLTFPISLTTANQLFEQDLEVARLRLIKAIPTVTLNQNQFDALISLMYRSGPGTFATYRKLIKFLNEGNYIAAADEWDDITLNDQNRSQAEKRLFLGL